MIKNDAFIESLPQEFSFLARSAVMEGIFEFHETVRIESKLKGKITASSPHTLTIGPYAQISGEIRAGKLEVLGHIEGKIDVEGQVIFYPGSKFEGTLLSAEMIIHPGAQVTMTAQTGQSARPS